MVILPPLSSMVVNKTIENPTEKLPSIKSVWKELMTRDTTPKNSPRHHYRAVSLPTTLPGNRPYLSSDKQHEKSSMDVLLKAIALDQKMSLVYKKERVKSFVREQQWLHKRLATPNFKHSNPLSTITALRRRSRSAPGAPMAHYYQHAALHSTRWYLPNHSEQESTRSSYDIAHALVQQHLKSASCFKK